MSDPNWISAFLSKRNSSYLNSLAITMSQVDDSWEADEHRIPEAEPLPFIDYKLVQKMISVLGVDLVKQEAEDYAVVMRARKFYYTAHNNFQYEHNGLEDSKAYDTMLKTQMKKLEDMGDEKNAKLKEKLEWTKISIQKNEKDINASVERVRKRWLKRTDATIEFGRVKTEFVEKVLPRLIEIGEKAGAEAADLASSLAASRSAPEVAPAPAPSPTPAPIDPLTLTSTPIPSTVISSTNPNSTEVMDSKSDSSQSMSISQDSMEVVDDTQAAVDVVEATQNLSIDAAVGETQAVSDTVEATPESSDPTAKTTEAASDAATVETATDPPRLNEHGERLPSARKEWWHYMI